MVHLVLLIFAAVCFAFAAFVGDHPKFNLVALGLLALVLTRLV